MGNVSSHTYTYAGKRSFACNCEENNGKCGLAPPNNRFERTHGTSPFAAQPNVMRTPSAHDETMKKYDTFDEYKKKQKEISEKETNYYVIVLFDYMDFPKKEKKKN